MWDHKPAIEDDANTDSPDRSVHSIVEAWLRTREAEGEDTPLGAVACPALGLAMDRASHCLFETADHRCYRTHEELQIPITAQIRFCLTPAYEECPVFQGDQASWTGRHFKWPPWSKKPAEVATFDEATDEKSGEA